MYTLLQLLFLAAMSCLRCKSPATYEVPLHFCSFACTAEHFGVSQSELVLIDAEKRKKEEEEESRKTQTTELKLKILDLSNRRLLRLQVQYAQLSNIMSRDRVFNKIAEIYLSNDNLHFPTVAKRFISVKWHSGSDPDKLKVTYAGNIIRKDQEWSNLKYINDVRMEAIGIGDIRFWYEHDSKTIEKTTDLDLFDFSKLNQTRFVAISIGGFARSQTTKILPFGHAFMLFVDTKFKEAVILEPNAKQQKEPNDTLEAFTGLMRAIIGAFSSLRDFSDYTFFMIQDLLTDLEGPQTWSSPTNKPRQSCQLGTGYCVSANYLWVEAFSRNAKDDLPISSQVQEITKRLKEVVMRWPNLSPQLSPFDLLFTRTEAQGGRTGDTQLASYASWLTDKVFSILIKTALENTERITWDKRRKEENIEDWLPAFLSDQSRREKTERAAVEYIKAASQ